MKEEQRGKKGKAKIPFDILVKGEDISQSKMLLFVEKHDGSSGSLTVGRSWPASSGYFWNCGLTHLDWLQISTMADVN